METRWRLSQRLLGGERPPGHDSIRRAMRLCQSGSLMPGGVSDRALALDQAAAHVRAALSEAVDPGARSASALPAHAPRAHASSRATHGGVPRGVETASYGVMSPAHV